MNKAITVSELKKDLDRFVAAGKGDYQIFITDDEECNGYHACWFRPTAADELDESERRGIDVLNSDIEILDDRNKAVYLG